MVALGAALLLAGCRHGGNRLDDSATRRMLGLLMPQQLSVEPFTRFAQLDEDDETVGLELYVRPTNLFGDPVNMVGTLRAELYAFAAASGDNRGERLEMWELPLVNERQQRKHWNRVTELYEFRLKLDPQRLPVHDQYVLEITHLSPFDERMSAVFVLQRPTRTERLGATAGR